MISIKIIPVLFLLLPGAAHALDGRLWVGVQAVEEHTGHEYETPVGEIGGEIYLARGADWSIAVIAEHKSRPEIPDTRGGLNAIGARIYYDF